MSVTLNCEAETGGSQELTDKPISLAEMVNSGSGEQSHLMGIRWEVIEQDTWHPLMTSVHSQACASTGMCIYACTVHVYMDSHITQKSNGNHVLGRAAAW